MDLMVTDFRLPWRNCWPDKPTPTVGASLPRELLTAREQAELA